MVDSVVDSSGRTINNFTGDLCSLTYLEGKYQGDHPRWRNLYYARPDCYYHYPSQKDLRACFTKHKVKAVFFVGDSILRSLYIAFLDLLGVGVDEETVKKNHGAGQILTIDGVAVDFAEYWFVMHAKRVQNRLSREYKKLDIGKGDTIVVIANIGIMHTLEGACNEGNGFTRGLELFKDFIETWGKENSMNTGAGPNLRLVAYGSPTVLGLRNSGVSMAKGLKMTQIMREQLVTSTSDGSTSSAPGSDKVAKSPFAFELLDMEPLSHARFDATEDGFHYGQSLKIMQAVGLTNMICNGHDDFGAKEEGSREGRAVKKSGRRGKRGTERGGGSQAGKGAHPTRQRRQPSQQSPTTWWALCAWVALAMAAAGVGVLALRLRTTGSAEVTGT